MQSSSYLFIDGDKTLTVVENADTFTAMPETESYGIDMVRKLKRWALLKPFSSAKKVALIREADKMTVPAQNALLKLLEEPPNNTHIILTTKNKERLLKTIRSRCQTLAEEALRSPELKALFNSTLQLTARDTRHAHRMPTPRNHLEALGISKKLSKEYERGEVQSLLESWLASLLSEPNKQKVLIADKIISAKEYLTHNTNVELTLSVMFFSTINCQP